MAEKANKPAIRFAGFTEAWEQRKLREMASLITKGTTPLDKSNTGNVNFVKIESIDEVSGEITITQKITSEEHEGYLRRSQLKENDILFSIAGTLGRVTSVKSSILPANTNQALAIIRLKTGDLQYVKTYLKGKAVSDYIKKNPTIGAQPNLSLEQVGDLEIALPTLDEQRRIGAYFHQLDDLITLHQRKYDTLVSVKKSMLEKMFPKNGSRVPEIRFKGFTEAWEQRKLETLAEFNPKSELPDVFEYVDLESVVGTEMASHREENKSSAPSRAQRLAKHGDLFYQTVRPYQRNNFLFEKRDNNYVFSTGYAQLRPHCDSYFLLCLVQNDLFVKNVLDRCTGTSYPAINSNDLAKMDMNVPRKIIEQQQIGIFFRSLDITITLHQRKLQKLKNIKKACLEKMFV
ncbi:restriction endonuclease subunit S [Guggenheimella bovis]